MNSEQTWLSKKLSPVIQEYNVVDLLLIGGALLTLVALFTPLLHPLVGVAIAWATYGIAKANGFYGEERSPMKNGMYTEIEEGSGHYCASCGKNYKEKTGYKMMFMLGYEIFRVESFHSNECEECELKDAPEREEEKREKQLA